MAERSQASGWNSPHAFIRDIALQDEVGGGFFLSHTAQVVFMSGVIAKSSAGSFGCADAMLAILLAQIGLDGGLEAVAENEDAIESVEA